MNSAKLNLWIDALKQHSECLNLTSIIWFWMNVEETDDWLSIVNELNQLNVKPVRKIDHLPLQLDLGVFAMHEGAKVLDSEPESFDWYYQFMNEMQEFLPKYKNFDAEYELEMLSLLGDEYEFPQDDGEKTTIQSAEYMQTFISMESLLEKLKADGRSYPSQFELVISDKHEQMHVSIFELAESLSGMASSDDGLLIFTPDEEAGVDKKADSEFSYPNEEDPFRAYKLVPMFTQVIWNSGIDKLLKKEFGSWTNQNMKNQLGDCFRLSGAKANSLRIITQQYFDRSQGSGKDLSQFIRPLAKLFWGSGKDSYLINKLLPKQRCKFVSEELGINESEYKAIKLVIEPDAILPGTNMEVSSRVHTEPTLVIDFVLDIIKEQCLESELFELNPQERKIYDSLLTGLRKFISNQ